MRHPATSSRTVGSDAQPIRGCSPTLPPLQPQRHPQPSSLIPRASASCTLHHIRWQCGSVAVWQCARTPFWPCCLALNH